MVKSIYYPLRFHHKQVALEPVYRGNLSILENLNIFMPKHTEKRN